MRLPMVPVRLVRRATDVDVGVRFGKRLGVHGHAVADGSHVDNGVIDQPVELLVFEVYSFGPVTHLKSDKERHDHTIRRRYGRGLRVLRDVHFATEHVCDGDGLSILFLFLVAIRPATSTCRYREAHEESQEKRNHFLENRFHAASFVLISVTTFT